MIARPDPAPHGATVRREVVIAAPPDEVWESLASEEGRERWLEPDLALELHVELESEPYRLVWWWSCGDQAPTRVEFLIVAAPAGARVIVTETVPVFPLEMLARAFALAPA